MTPTPASVIATLREAEKAMTKGPWAPHTWDGDLSDIEHGVLYADGHDSTVMDLADAAGIAAMRNALPALLDVASLAEALCKADQHGNCIHCMHDVEVCDCGLHLLRASVAALAKGGT
jgi:hypothetical protein